MHATLSNEHPEATKFWKHAADILDISAEVPYNVILSNGASMRCSAYIPHFGGPSGTITILHQHGQVNSYNELSRVAAMVGKYGSVVYTSNKFDLAVFIDSLSDWGYYGARDERPPWLPRQCKNMPLEYPYGSNMYPSLEEAMRLLEAIGAKHVSISDEDGIRYLEFETKRGLKTEIRIRHE